MESNNLYISLGIQCLTPTILKENNLRTNSYPFDWILSNPYFVYKIMYLLLEDNMEISKIVREHFFRKDKKSYCNKIEHYVISKKGHVICNRLYNVIFPHDLYNNETIKKYERRFERLKKVILNKNQNLKFIYISQSSLNSGNFTINGQKVVNNVYITMNKIIKLINKYNTNSKLIIFDSIQEENEKLLNKDIKLFKISPKESWKDLTDEVNSILSKII